MKLSEEIRDILQQINGSMTKSKAFRIDNTQKIDANDIIKKTVIANNKLKQLEQSNKELLDALVKMVRYSEDVIGDSRKFKLLIRRDDNNKIKSAVEAIEKATGKTVEEIMEGRL